MEVDTAEEALRSSPVQHASHQSIGAPPGIGKHAQLARPKLMACTCSTCKGATTEMPGLMVKGCAAVDSPWYGLWCRRRMLQCAGAAAADTHPWG